MEITILVLFLAVGILVGVLTTWLICKFYYASQGITPAELKSKYVLKQLWESEMQEVTRLASIIEKKELQIQEIKSDLGAAEQTSIHLNEKIGTQKKELQEFHFQMQSQFENLANKLFEEKSLKISHQNQLQLRQVLEPLRSKLDGFEKKVEDVYFSEAKQRASLQGEIKSLMELNQKISQEAKNLTDALKGDNKKQGNWGELILEKVLERSGLNKDSEYSIQYSSINGNGQRIQPDVVINLPDNKHLVIDSKVSLTSYERFVNGSNQKEQQEALKMHILSIRHHIKGLADKNYSSAKSLDCPDFVILFMPMESAFSAAVKADPEIFNYAWEQKIVIVSPTTLLATLKTVASIWKQEKQTRHAVDIARQAGALYDKFVGFVDDMKKVEHSIETIDKTYRAAMNKLQFGKGNLIGRAEKMKALGLKTVKKLPASVLESQLIDDAN